MLQSVDFGHGLSETAAHTFGRQVSSNAKRGGRGLCNRFGQIVLVVVALLSVGPIISEEWLGSG